MITMHLVIVLWAGLGTADSCDALMVCDATSCEAAVIPPTCTAPLDLDTCLDGAEVWIGEVSEEAYTVLGCSPDATRLVVDLNTFEVPE